MLSRSITYGVYGITKKYNKFGRKKKCKNISLDLRSNNNKDRMVFGSL